MIYDEPSRSFAVMNVETALDTTSLPSEPFLRWCVSRGWASRAHQVELLAKVRVGPVRAADRSHGGARRDSIPPEHDRCEPAGGDCHYCRGEAVQHAVVPRGGGNDLLEA